MEQPILTIIIPCYNEESILNSTFQELFAVLSNLISKKLISDKSYLCFVDDGSTDKTWDIIQSLQPAKNTKGLKLSRNFGHQAAIFAGLCETNADIFISIDADLQDDISLIEHMVIKFHEGFDIVYGVRNNRQSDDILKRLTAWGYYSFAKSLGICAQANHGDFRLISKKIADILKTSKETNLYLRGMIPALGFKSTTLYYSRQARIGGTPKYTYRKLLNLALDGITSFSEKPLRFVFILGATISLLSLLLLLGFLLDFILYKKIHKTFIIIFSIWLLGGLQITAIGIVAEYIGKIFNQVKEKPRYILEEKTN